MGLHLNTTIATTIPIFQITMLAKPKSQCFLVKEVKCYTDSLTTLGGKYFSYLCLNLQIPYNYYLRKYYLVIEKFIQKIDHLIDR